MLNKNILIRTFYGLLSPLGILPGHGRMAKFNSVAEKNSSILKAADDFDNEDETEGLLSVGYF